LLENVRDVVDEIIVVDGFSDDDTVEIARSYDAKVF
jgi:glycosyltransferase involved in cell wall biosynthesis